MSRRNKEEDQIERLEKENRNLKSAIRTLTKKLRKINKGYYKLRDNFDEIEEDVKPDPDADKVCFDCSGALKLIVIANRRFRVCNGCGKKTRTKFLNEKT